MLLTCATRADNELIARSYSATLISVCVLTLPHCLWFHSVLTLPHWFRSDQEYCFVSLQLCDVIPWASGSIISDNPIWISLWYFWTNTRLALFTWLCFICAIGINITNLRLVVCTCSMRHATLTLFQTNPLLVRVDTDSGHGAGKPTAKIVSDCHQSVSLAAAL